MTENNKRDMSNPPTNAPGVAECPRTTALMSQLAKHGYSAANDRATSLCWELERELATLRARVETLEKLLREYVPNFAQPRYFNTDGQYAYERTVGEVRARYDEVCEGDHFTVVKPHPELGYTIHIGGIQPREHVIALLRERLAREYEHYAALNATPSQEGA